MNFMATFWAKDMRQAVTMCCTRLDTTVQVRLGSCMHAAWGKKMGSGEVRFEMGFDLI